MPLVLSPFTTSVPPTFNASNAWAIRPNVCGLKRVISTNAKSDVVVTCCVVTKPRSFKRSHAGLNHCIQIGAPTSPYSPSSNALKINAPISGGVAMPASSASDSRMFGFAIVGRADALFLFHGALQWVLMLARQLHDLHNFCFSDVM